jgi:hypothetical protein
MTIMSYGGCDLDKLLARGLAARDCYAPTEEPNTGAGFYLCTAGHMHQVFRMSILRAHRPGRPWWSDGTRVLEPFGFDPAFYKALVLAEEAAEAQSCIEENLRVFTERMTAMGYGDVLDDPD